MKDKLIEIITGDTKYPAPFTHRVLILCEEKNIPHRVTQIDTEQKPEWFLAIAPLGLVPVIRFDENIIFDSHPICEFLDTLTSPRFLPENTIECAKYKSWLMFADEISQEIATLVKQGNIRKANFSRLNRLFEILDKQLKHNFFYGEQFSLIDIYLISHILWLDALEQTILSKPIIQNYSNISRWMKTIKQRDSIKNTMGENYTQYFIELLQKYNLV